MFSNRRMRPGRMLPLLICTAALLLAACGEPATSTPTPSPGLPSVRPTAPVAPTTAPRPTREPIVVTYTPTPIVAPAAITIDSPPPGTLVGSPVVIAGHADRAPLGGQLSYQFLDQNGRQIGDGTFPVSDSGQGAQFNVSLSFEPPPQGGNIRLDLFERRTPDVRTTLDLFVAPPQAITITSPPPGTFVGSPVVIIGQLARLPFQSHLSYRILASQGQLLGQGIIPVSGEPGRPTSFNASLTFSLPPAGGDIRLELYDQNPADGTIAASATLPLRVAPQSQQIIFTSPPPDTVVGSPVVITGRTIRFPAQATLGYRITDSRGLELGRGAFPVTGAQGQGAQFNASLTFNLPPQGGPVRIEVRDQNASTGVIIASATLQVQVIAQQQTITIETPPPDTLVGSPVVITGRTMLYPRNGSLSYRVRASNGQVLGGGSFRVNGAQGQPSTFVISISFQPDRTADGLIFVDIFEPGASGGVVASASIQLRVAVSG